MTHCLHNRLLFFLREMTTHKKELHKKKVAYVRTTLFTTYAPFYLLLRI